MIKELQKKAEQASDEAEWNSDPSGFLVCGDVIKFQLIQLTSIPPPHPPIEYRIVKPEMTAVT